MSPAVVALLAAAVSASAAVDERSPAAQRAATGQESEAPEDAGAAPGGGREPKQDSISFFGARFSVVAGAAVLWPTSREVRDEYGATHPSLSVGFWSFRAQRGFGFSFDAGWRAFGRDASGEVNIWNANAGVLWLGRERTRDAIPYVSVRTGPQLVKIPDRDLRFALGVTLETGLVLWRRLILSGRYDYITPTAGLDLSNLSARLAIRVF